MLEYADEAGFWCYHKAEHHFTPLDAAPSSTVFLAAASQRTERIRLGSLVMLLPFYEPLRFIEEICMLDNLCGGRLEVGVGKGISPAEHALWGQDPNTARARFEEAFEIVRIGLSRASPEVEATGSTAGSDADEHGVLESATERYRRTGSADHVPRPLRTLQKPRPGFWYPGNVDYAGRHRLHTIIGGSTRAINRAMEIYRKGLAQPDGDWNPGVAEPVIGVQAHIYLDATPEAAIERVRQALLGLPPEPDEALAPVPGTDRPHRSYVRWQIRCSDGAQRPVGGFPRDSGRIHQARGRRHGDRVPDIRLRLGRPDARRNHAVDATVCRGSHAGIQGVTSVFSPFGRGRACPVPSRITHQAPPQAP